MDERLSAQHDERMRQLVAAITAGVSWSGVNLPLPAGDSCGPTLDEAVDALETVADRYREALERIAAQGCGRIEDGRLVSDDGKHPWLHWGQIARDALAEPRRKEPSA